MTAAVAGNPGEATLKQISQLFEDRFGQDCRARLVEDD